MAPATRLRSMVWPFDTGWGALALLLAASGCSPSNAGADASATSGASTSAGESTATSTGGGGGGGAGGHGGGDVGGDGGGGSQPDAGLPTSISGLEVAAEVDVPNGPKGTPHLTEIVVGEILHVADGFGGVVAYQLGDAGFTPVFQTALAGLRCTSIAVHAPTKSVYCAGADVDAIAILDAPTGVLRTPGNFNNKFSTGYADAHVRDDGLYLAAFDKGLVRAPIDDTGALGAPVPVLEGDIVGVDGEGSTLVALDRERGLVFLENDVEVGTVALDGPVLRLSVHAGRVSVALGSRGGVVVDVASRATLAEVHPPCVVTAVDAAPGGVAAGCLGGLYVYDGLASPHVAGWRPSRFGVLDVRFSGDRLLTTNWWSVTSYKLSGSGPVGVEAPYGFFLASGGGMTFDVRNPSEVEQHLHGAVIGPLATAPVVVAPSDDPKTIVDLVTDEEGISGLIPQATILRGLNRPALGAVFPIPMQKKYVTFMLPDCPLQWPALVDISWLAAHGGLPGGVTPIVLGIGSDDEWGAGPFAAQWGELDVHRLKEYMPGGASQDIFDINFSGNGLILGPDITSDYTLDEAGVVVGYDRIYRGAYPLAASPASL